MMSDLYALLNVAELFFPPVMFHRTTNGEERQREKREERRENREERRGRKKTRKHYEKVDVMFSRIFAAMCMYYFYVCIVVHLKLVVSVA